MKELSNTETSLTILCSVVATVLATSAVLFLCVTKTMTRVRERLSLCWGSCCDRSYAQGVDPHHPAFRTTEQIEENNVVFEPLPEQVVTVARVEDVTDVKEDGDGDGVKRSKIRFTDTIGHGWFGWIVSGSMVGHGKVIVKILREEAKPEEFERFKLEHESLSAVSHQNVVQTVGFCFNSFPMLSLLEWCEHTSAKTFLTKLRSDPNLDLTLQLAMDASAGVAALHNYNIILADLAARNCVLTDQLVLKIGDYGLGRAAFPADYWPLLTDSVPLRWTAPRQLTKSEHRTIPTYSRPLMEDNLWSMAILIWEILTYCRQPYGDVLDRDIVELLLERRSVTSYFRSEASAGLKVKCVTALVCQSLHMDPLARITAANMEHQLRIIARAGQHEMGELFHSLTEQGTLAGFQEVDISDYQEEFNLSNPGALRIN